MNAYYVRMIDNRTKQVRRGFECMASDSCAAVDQHIDLCEPGEKLEVMGLDAWRELQRDHRALVQQINRPDELSRVMQGGM
jgi:hypothetical protein